MPLLNINLGLIKFRESTKGENQFSTVFYPKLTEAKLNFSESTNLNKCNSE